MQTLVMTIIGDDRPGLVDSLSSRIADGGGNWLESRMSHLAGQFAGILRIQIDDEGAPALVAEMEKLAQNLFISMSTMAQYAALAGFEPATREILEQRRDIFRERRDFLLPAVKELGFCVPCSPQGAFYIYADASRFTDDSQRFCLDMLEEHGVALTPGLDFGHHRANEHLRFSYTTGMDRLELAVERLARVLG